MRPIKRSSAEIKAAVGNQAAGMRDDAAGGGETAPADLWERRQSYYRSGISSGAVRSGCSVGTGAVQEQC